MNKAFLGKKRLLFLILPPPDGRPPAQSDPVLARCPGIASKAAYLLPPLGFLYYAALLREKGGIIPEILDAFTKKMGKSGILAFISRFRPDYIVFSPPTPYFSQYLDFVGALKSKYPRIKTVFCGPHASYFWEKSLLSGSVDFVLRGEIDLSLLELIIADFSENQYKRIDGLCFIHEKGCPHANSLAPLIQDLDILPPPAWDLLKDHDYKVPFSRKSRFNIMITARGCPYGCSYCTTYGTYGYSWRFHSVERVIGEIKRLKALNYHDIGFWDDTFTVDLNRVAEICHRILEEKLNIRWIALARTDTVNGKILKLMARAGCYQLQYGVEANSGAIMRELGKTANKKIAKRAFLLTRETGIEISAFFMVGHPKSGLNDDMKTVEMALKLNPDFASFNILTPFPGSKIYEHWRINADFVQDFSLFDTRHSILNQKEGQKLEKLLSVFYRKYYFRPSYLYRMMTKNLTFWRFFSGIKTAFLLLFFGRKQKV